MRLALRIPPSTRRASVRKRLAEFAGSLPNGSLLAWSYGFLTGTYWFQADTSL